MKPFTLICRQAALAFALFVGCDSTPAPMDAALDQRAEEAGLDERLRDGSMDAQDGAPTPFVLELAWTACSLRSEEPGDDAECARFDVPLQWSNRDGERISLFIKRHRGAPGGGQAWFLTGGPGQTGADLEPLVEQLVAVDSERSYYLLDHRGVGRSTRLRCPSSEGLESPNGIGLGEGEIEACLAEVRAEWTDAQLAGFSTINAAHDVGEVIAHLREDDEVVALWGGSYGTHWLERYLNLYPEQPSSVIFSAVAIDVDLLSVDRYVDDLARRWLRACDAEESCGSRFVDAFGDGAETVVSQALSGEGRRLCPELEALEIDVPALKPFFGQLFNDIQGRSLVAPLAYRLVRCAPEDVAAIGRLIENLTPPGGVPALPYGVRNWGFVLSENIAVSELTQPRSSQEIADDYARAIAVQGPTPRLAESRAIWPRYEAPPFRNSDYTGPLLLLHGEYDFLPPEVYTRTVEHYERMNPNADFVLLPGAPHSLESPTIFAEQCGIGLIVSRLLNPDVPVADCAGRVR
ncbi:MAG: hypothetical protein AAF938_28585, partial [Myxococcota bacterium]